MIITCSKQVKEGITEILLNGRSGLTRHTLKTFNSADKVL